MTTSRERFVEAARKQQDGRPILLVEIERPVLDSEIENPPVEKMPEKLYYGTEAVSSGELFYENRLIPPSGIIRETQVLGQSFRSNRITIELMDHDGEVGKYLASGKLYGKEFVVKAGFEEMDLDDYQTLFYGQVKEFSASGGKATIVGTDESPRMPQLPEGQISEKDFTNLPDSSKNATLPIVLGSVEETGGAIQAIRLSSTEYGVASHRVCDIKNVYVDGVAKTKGTDYSVELRKVKPELGFYAQIKFNAAVNENAIVRADVDGVGSDFINLKKYAYQGSAINDQGVVLNGSSEWLEGGAGTFGVSSADFTLEAGFTHAQGSAPQMICALGDEIAAGKKRWKLWVGTDNKVYFAVVRTDTDNFETAVSTKTVVPGSYNRVKLVWDEADSSVHFYVNDMDSNMVGINSNTSVGVDNQPFRVGAIVNTSSWSVGSYFNGTFHSLRVRAGKWSDIEALVPADCTRAWEFQGNLTDYKGQADLTKTLSSILYLGQMTESETVTALKLNGSSKYAYHSWGGCGTSNADFTVEAQVKHISQTTDRTICSKGNENVGGQQRWKLGISSASKVRFNMGKSSGNGYYQYDSTAVLPTSQFNRIKVVWEHSAKRLTFYVNGNQSGQYTLPSDAQPGDVGLPFRLGCAYNYESDIYLELFDGDVDYLRIRHAAESNGNSLTLANSNRAWELNNSLTDSKGVADLTGSGISSGDYYQHTISTIVPGVTGFNFPGSTFIEGVPDEDHIGSGGITVNAAFISTSLSVFRTICHKGNEASGEYGWKLWVNTDKRVNFSLANTAGTGYAATFTSSGTILESRYQSAKVVWNRSTSQVKLYLNGTLDSTHTVPAGVRTNMDGLRFRIGATGKTKTTGYTNVFGGSINFVRIKNSADSDGSEVTYSAATQAWELDSNYNAKLGGRMFLKTVLASSYQNPVVGYNYYYNWPYLIASGLSTMVTKKQFTLVSRFRLNGSASFGRNTLRNNWNILSLNPYAAINYMYGSKKLELVVYDSAATRYVALEGELPDGIPSDEWVEVIATYDVADGKGKLYVNRQKLEADDINCKIQPPANFTFLSTGHGDIPQDMDVDFIGYAGVSTFDRRNPMPKPHEFQLFWDFEQGSMVDSISSKSVSVSLVESVSGETYNVSNHYSLPDFEKNNPAEDVREALHLLGERANADSIRQASDSFDNRSLINTITVNGTQWGGCIPKSASGAESGREILEKMARNCDSILTVGVKGDWSLKPMNFDASISDGVEYRANEEIIKDSFSVSYQSDLQNTGDANWSRKYRKLEEKEEQFGRKERMGVEQSVQELGREYESDPDEYDYIRGEKMAEGVALSRMLKRAKAIPTASFKVPLVGLQSDIGDVVFITHPEGPSEDGRGWIKKPMTVERISLDRNANTVDMRVVGRELHPEAVFGWGSGDTEIEEVTLSPSLDIYVDSSDQNADTHDSAYLKHGGYKAEMVDLIRMDDIQRACFRFNLSQIPALAVGEEIVGASFSFYLIPTGRRSGIDLRELAYSDLTQIGWGSTSNFRNFVGGSYWSDFYIRQNSFGAKYPVAGSNVIEINEHGLSRIQAHLGGDLDLTFGQMNGALPDDYDHWEGYDIPSADFGTESQRPKLTIKIKRNKGE